MYVPSLPYLSPTDMHPPTPVILSLQQPSGVFAGDQFGEIDTRFLYCAVSALSLLGRLHELDKDGKREKTVEYILRCRNYDGGFGSCVGAESHAAQGSFIRSFFFFFQMMMVMGEECSYA